MIKHFPKLGKGAAKRPWSRAATILSSLLFFVSVLGQKIRCRHVIVDETNAPDVAQMQFQNYIARAVYVTDRPLTPISSAANSAQKSSSDNVCDKNIFYCKVELL